MSQYNISPKHFNPLFWELKKHINNPNVRQIIIYGGTSAAKTYTISQLLLIDGYNNEYNSAVFKKEGTTIDSYVYNDFKTIRDRFKLNSKYTYFRKIIRYKKNEIRFFGLDDPEKAKGISSFKKIYCNELSKFDEADYDELLDRMRGMKGQQIICDFNPIREKHWIKRKIFDSEEFRLLENKHLHPTSSVKTNVKGDIVIIKTTYLDNYWVVGSPCKTYGYIDHHVKARYEKLKTTDYNRYQITALGEWGQEKPDNPYYSCFSHQYHIKDQEFEKDKQLIISLDFNNNPYITCLVSQANILDNGKYKLRIVREHCIEPPNNTTKDLIQHLTSIYSWTDKPIWIYGDYSGANKKGMGLEYNGQRIDDHYSLIEAIFKKNKISCVNKIAPNENVLRRHDFIQAVLSNSMPLSIEVDSSCKNLINDLEHCRYNIEGKKEKKVIRDKEKGTSYEELGHTSDALEYLLCGLFNGMYNSFERYY